MNKKVVFVMPRLGGKGWGGAHRVSVMLSNYLANSGYDTTIIVRENSSIDYPVDSKIRIICLDAKDNSASERLKCCFSIRNILKNYKDAYVIVFISRIAVETYLSCLFLRVKIIGSERTDPRNEPKRAAFRFLRGLIFGYMYKTVYQTPEAMKYFPKKAQKNGKIIPNPISPNLPERFNGIRKKEIVTFCRIDKQKNLPLLIDSFIEVHEKVPDYILRIYGEGIIEDEIKAYILDKNADTFIFMEPFSNEIHEKVVDCTAYVSSSNYEGLSNSMLEAMAIGLPSICTDCPIGGARMVISNNENGVLVPVNDKDSMVSAILKLIQDPVFADKLSRNAVKIRDELCIDKICREWEMLLQ
ncbi:glycosyltransferase [Anaerocolumna sp. AGMB13025]|uniref:glycosyltransferase n=1 Tax=Anaerocolumna sp. AGMB13025 TaxID=3039116 RepID=UPI00241EB028|nr:glycosyltransferase [Anaerocolumna sp. AGMB13025]WFR57881.1 glycosyltransferase [Anaerocolumna sp. AGMB13025]